MRAPVVILEAGKRGADYQWTAEIRDVATYTRICAFDQLGGGYSGPAPPDRSDVRVAADTHALLHTAGVEPPYVFGEYGKGAAHGQRFEEQYPSEIAGRVSFDGKKLSQREDPKLANQELRAAVAAARQRNPTIARAMPGSLRPSVPPASTLPFDGLVDVDGIKLHLRCQGAGVPIVIMDAGLGWSGAAWLAELPEVAKVTRVCVYDRPDRGFGPSVRGVTTGAQKAEQLRGLLNAAKLPAPYVLVGHSIGGLFVQFYDFAHPEEVAGLVLVDSTCERSSQMAIDFQDDDQRKALDGWLKEDPDEFDLATFVRTNEDARRLRRPIGDKLVVILAQGIPLKEGTPEHSAALEKTKRDELAAIAASATNGAVVVADGTGHMINIDRPMLTAAAIREVVTAVRTHAKIDANRIHETADAAPSPAADW